MRSCDTGAVLAAFVRATSAKLWVVSRRPLGRRISAPASGFAAAMSASARFHLRAPDPPPLGGALLCSWTWDHALRAAPGMGLFNPSSKHAAGLAAEGRAAPPCPADARRCAGTRFSCSLHRASSEIAFSAEVRVLRLFGRFAWVVCSACCL